MPCGTRTLAWAGPGEGVGTGPPSCRPGSTFVRHALRDQGDLVPYPELVRERYVNWLAAQEAEGRLFTPEQRWWLDHIAEHIGVNLAIDTRDFDYGDFFDRGGRLAAARTFGTELASLLSELNMTLVA